jgi:hypothetical protein
MNHQSRECCRWGRVWSVWWDNSFHHLDDQAKNTNGQWSFVLAQRPPWKSQEIQKTKSTMERSKMIAHTMLIKCLFLWNCEEYPRCVKIWSFEWKFDFHWSFVWNILNVWKYYHLSKKLTFIDHLCEISSMCANMVIWVKILFSLVICVKYHQCVKIWSFEWKFDSVLCSVSYVKCWESVSHGSKRETHVMEVCLASETKGRHMLWRRVSHLNQKRDAHYRWRVSIFLLYIIRI